MVDYIRERLPAGASIRVRDFGRPLAADLVDTNVILPSNARIDAAAIGAPRDLRLIQQPAVGYEGIDLDAARARGVPACNAPAANSAAVAETALFLLIALAKRLPEAERAFAGRQIGVPVGTELDGKTIGIIGLGRSGSRVAATATALGMNVHSVRSAAGRDAFLALLGKADFVSIHCPLSPATRGIPRQLRSRRHRRPRRARARPPPPRRRRPRHLLGGAVGPRRPALRPRQRGDPSPPRRLHARGLRPPRRRRRRQHRPRHAGGGASLSRCLARRASSFFFFSSNASRAARPPRKNPITAPSMRIIGM